jgi:hypothetical protein
VPHPALLFAECVDTIKPSVSVPDFETETLYFFRFVKEQLQPTGQKTRAKRRTLSSAFLLRQESASELVEVNGIEPMTSCLQSMRSPN